MVMNWELIVNGAMTGLGTGVGSGIGAYFALKLNSHILDKAFKKEGKNNV
jgi:hypothetical protein